MQTTSVSPSAFLILSLCRPHTGMRRVLKSDNTQAVWFSAGHALNQAWQASRSLCTAQGPCLHVAVGTPVDSHEILRHSQAAARPGEDVVHIEAADRIAFGMQGDHIAVGVTPVVTA